MQGNRLVMTTMLGLAACAQAAGNPAVVPTAHWDDAPDGRWVPGSFLGGAGSREYQLYVPGGYDPARRHMLVVLLHGCTQDPLDLARGTRIAEHARHGGFLALLPAQPPGANAMKCWNWFDGRHQAREAGEPSLVAGMTQEVTTQYAIDPDRVHLAGISAGGAMASLVAVAYPDLYASIAVHSAPAWRAASDVGSAMRVMANGSPEADSLGSAAWDAMGAHARSVPALIIHGAMDDVVKPANGRDATRQWVATNARALGVASLDATETMGETNGLAWTRICHAGRDARCVVEHWTVAGLKHAWSGGSAEGTFADPRGPDATAEMVRFFRDHPRQAR